MEVVTLTSGQNCKRCLGFCNVLVAFFCLPALILTSVAHPLMSFFSFTLVMSKLYSVRGCVCVRVGDERPLFD